MKDNICDVYDAQCMRRLEAGICASWYGGYISHQPHDIVAKNGTRFPYEPHYREEGRDSDFAYPSATMVLPSGNWVDITRYHEGENWRFELKNCMSGDTIAVFENTNIKKVLSDMVKTEEISIAA